MIAWGSTPILRINPNIWRGELYHWSTLGIQTSDFLIKGVHSIPQTILFILSTLPSSLHSHQMSLRVVVVALATLFLFAGFAAAGKEDHPEYPDSYDHHKIWGPKCHDEKWGWVCILSLLLFVLWLISNLLALCLDVQFYWSTPVQDRSLPAVNMPRWL